MRALIEGHGVAMRKGTIIVVSGRRVRIRSVGIFEKRNDWRSLVQGCHIPLGSARRALVQPGRVRDRLGTGRCRYVTSGLLPPGAVFLAQLLHARSDGSCGHGPSALRRPDTEHIPSARPG